MTLILGMQVTGIVDRPMGSTHPTHTDIVYPINYGYVEVISAAKVSRKMRIYLVHKNL